VASLLHRLTHNWQLKLTALVLAFLFWAALRREQPYIYTFDKVPVRVISQDPDWVLSTPPDPPTVRVTLQGPGGELLQAAGDPPEVHVPIENVTDSTVMRAIEFGWVAIGELPQTRVTDVQPAAVRLAFERLGAKLLPIAFEFSGRAAEGFQLVGPPIIDPPVVRASGGLRRLARVDSVRLPINLDGRRGVDTLEIPIDTTGTGLILSPNRIRVILPFAQVPDTLPRSERF
jgi:YbbR domain-containing protein